MVNLSFNVSPVIGIAIRKALEFKNAKPFTNEEWQEFWKQLSSDEEFLEAYKKIVEAN